MDELKHADLVGQSSASALLLSWVKQYKVLGWSCPLAALFYRSRAGEQWGILPSLSSGWGMRPSVGHGC